MKILTAVAAAWIAAIASAQAGVTKTQLDAVTVEAVAGATLPLSLSFADDHGAGRTLGGAMAGKPAVLVFADYTCTNLCGPILSLTAAGLERSGLAPGRDYRFIVVGLDPKDGIGDARTMKAAQIGSNTPLADATTFLTGTPGVTEAVTEAAGYRYVYDAEHDQFAHPAAVFVLAADGRIVRVLSGLGLSGADLRLALIDAGQGRIGSVLDQIRLRCFGFDAERGIYTASISRMIAIAAAATVVLLFGGISFMAFGLRGRARP